METYLPLKKKFVEIADSLKEELEAIDPHLLKTLRYRPETLLAYHPTTSSLFNLLQLLVLLVNSHLDGLVSYFLVLSEASSPTLSASISTDCSANLSASKDTSMFNPENPFDFMTEFAVRYRQYRNAIFDMQV